MEVHMQLLNTMLGPILRTLKGPGGLGIKRACAVVVVNGQGLTSSIDRPAFR